jgi:hypothetical protein
MVYFWNISCLAVIVGSSLVISITVLNLLLRDIRIKNTALPFNYTWSWATRPDKPDPTHTKKNPIRPDLIVRRAGHRPKFSPEFKK